MDCSSIWKLKFQIYFLYLILDIDVWIIMQDLLQRGTKYSLPAKFAFFRAVQGLARPPPPLISLLLCYSDNTNIYCIISDMFAKNTSNILIYFISFPLKCFNQWTWNDWWLNGWMYSSQILLNVRSVNAAVVKKYFS